MSVEHPRTAEGWSEYAHTILMKLGELHQDSKETKQSIEELKFAVEKLKINQETIAKVDDWREEVMDVWSPRNMQEARKEIYVQKGKWATVYGVILTIQVIWIILVAYFKSK